MMIAWTFRILSGAGVLFALIRIDRRGALGMLAIMALLFAATFAPRIWVLRSLCLAVVGLSLWGTATEGAHPLILLGALLFATMFVATYYRHSWVAPTLAGGVGAIFYSLMGLERGQLSLLPTRRMSRHIVTLADDPDLFWFLIWSWLGVGAICLLVVAGFFLYTYQRGAQQVVPADRPRPAGSAGR